MYFDKSKAVDPAGDKNTAEVVKTILRRYMSANPSSDFTLTAFLNESFGTEQSGSTVVDFDALYPSADIGDIAYARCCITSPDESDTIFFSDLSSNTKMYLNGKMIGNTIDCDEALGDVRKIYGHLVKGKNELLVRCKKTALGFYAKFGRPSHRAEPFYFMVDTPKLSGVLGWEYSPLYKDEPEEISWVSHKGLEGDFKSAFDGEKGWAYQASFLECEKDMTVKLNIKSNALYRIFVNGNEILQKSADCTADVQCKCGINYIASCVQCEGNTYFEITSDNGAFINPFDKKCGYTNLYAGPCDKIDEKAIAEFNLTHLVCGNSYWRYSKGVHLRLNHGESLFGRWSYPLGVSLRGMLRWADTTCDDALKDYVASYSRAVCGVYDYALWDAQKYVVSLVLRQQSIIELLDDFGSFESALADIAIGAPNPTIDRILKRGADFIKHTLPRTEDGTMYRKALLPLARNINHNHLTMWADDLYMGAVFMCRYYKYSGDESFLDDAVHQFISYFDYLYSPAKRLMSHVYSFRRGAKTDVAWGRGNGWVIFSLTELLAVMPKEHKDYNRILEIFNTLCAGVLSYQGDNGMWHQVINDADSFCEASSTAMFACAYLRGIKNGWIEDAEYVSAALNAWKAIKRYCVDCDGNIYGICKGSGFSYREEYYKHELPWVKNDTHGMGIIILLATEIYEYESEGQG